MAEILEWRGKVYHRTDAPAADPHVGRPAQPWQIPIKGRFGKTSGVLGTTKVALDDSTMRAVIYPKRGGAYNPRNVRIQPRPYYYLRDENNKRYRVYMELCIECGFYQRRDAFAPDRRKRNGLQSICHTCDRERKRKAPLTAQAA